MTQMGQAPKKRLQVSQETVVIVTAALALAGLNLVTSADLRDLREDWQAESRQLRDEASADRQDFQRKMERWSDEARADRENFQEKILQLSVGQAELRIAGEATRE